MGQWSKEDLQPSLLDRLTDLQPKKTRESVAQQVLSHQQYRAAVIRDLSWLLNSVSMVSVLDLEAYPEIRRSVLNYGMPDISGHTSASIDTDRLQKAIKKIIYRFEPRIIQNTLEVRVISDPDQMAHNSLVFEIDGVVFGQPMPFPVRLRSELDLECCEFSISEQVG